MSDATTPPRLRGTYRHGNLRRALLAEGIQLARGGGPDAVTLREATRRAGVVPNAAYRHFANRQDLLLAVRAAALSEVAQSMETELAALSPDLLPADHARASLRAVGIGYLRFARAEPGLFHTAFVSLIQPNDTPSIPSSNIPSIQPSGAAPPGQAGRTGLGPVQILSGALDAMVTAKVLPADRRPAAEFLAWSAVHGLAMLVLDGPLRGMDPHQIDAIIPRLLAMVEIGL
jgi:AcrR family transcriptional regulator